ncbi:MAG: outer membrane protein assembly factor BamD [Campylobacterota bacterium]
MKKTVLHLMITAAIIFAFAGCADKAGVSEYNKSASYWYEKIVESIRTYDLDMADDYYLSLQSEHPKSPMLEAATLILAKAHEDSRENLLAEFYYDEYVKRYAQGQNMAYYQFKKVDSAFKHLKATNKNQKLIHETIADAQYFLENYADSVYVPAVETIKTKLQMTKYMINENIAGLYDRVGKEKAADIYRQRNESSWIAGSDLKLPEKSLIQIIFE